MQAMFFIVLFTQEHLASLVSFFDFGVWDVCLQLRGEKCDVLVRNLLEAAKKQIARGQQEQSPEGLHFGLIWGWIMFAFIGWFLVSCIEQFAQAKENELSKKK